LPLLSGGSFQPIMYFSDEIYEYFKNTLIVNSKLKMNLRAILIASRL